MEDQQQYLENGLAKAREAARELAGCDDQTMREILYDLANRTMAACDDILSANQKDLARMPEADPKYDRLLLNFGRLQAITDDLRFVADLPSPVGEICLLYTSPSPRDS